MSVISDHGAPCLHCGNKCSGFEPHSWRKSCTICGCSINTHNIHDKNYSQLLETLHLENHPQASQYNEALRLARQLGYTWLPIGLEAYEVEQFLACLPESLVPRAGTPGDQDRGRRLRLQVPPRDRCSEALVHLISDNPEERKEADNFFSERNLKGISFARVDRVDEHDGIKCRQCNETIGFGEFCAHLDKSLSCIGGGDSSAWHPACFRCWKCKNFLIDYLHGNHSGRALCQRHYVEMLRPRCFTCDELIFSSHYTKAMEQEQHQGHFACKQCEKALTGQRYILKEEQPYCLQCYEQVFANTCEECKEKIGCDSKDMSFKERHWHEKCFKCSDCQSSLVDKPFATKDDILFCSECYDNKFAARCDACSNVFKAGMRKYEYRGKQWHEECFICLECKQPIGAKSFIPRDQNVVCVPCYEEKYAQRCTKCTQVIRRGGVTYKGEPWHKECFTCTNCDKQLAGIKFTSKEDKPYCSECYGDLFAKKCCKCTKPITGFGGCKFISFEERHWHSECFSCNKCECNLVGRGFLTNEDRIICPDCGR